MVLPSATDLVDPTTLDPDDRLFVHRTVPEWGVGLWVREERKRRRLRFEDGELRAFARGYYHLLEPVDVTEVDVDETFRAIARDHELARSEQVPPSRAADPVMRFDDQIRILRHRWPGGFAGEAWRDAFRTPSDGRFRRAHHDDAVALAKERLSKEALAAARAAGASAVWAGLLAVLDATVTVKPSSVGPLRDPDGAHVEALADALAGLLYGEGRYRTRFDAWIAALGAAGATVTWPLATAPAALRFPSKHVCVRRQVFQLQGRVVRPGTRLRKRPVGRSYVRARRIAVATRDRLAAAGEAPADLLDVRTFIWQTLRPKARAVLATLR